MSDSQKKTTPNDPSSDAPSPKKESDQKKRNDQPATQQANSEPSSPNAGAGKKNSPDARKEKTLERNEGGNTDDSPSSQESKQKQDKENSTETSPPPIAIAMRPQQSQSGQNAETNRRQLKITQRLSAVADSKANSSPKGQIRDRLRHIEQMLEQAESTLRQLIEREVNDTERDERLRHLDRLLGSTEKKIATLREETKDGEFAFVGLQMVDIGRTHVTPGRNRVFEATRAPGGAYRKATDALQHIVRARELLSALLTRYDRVTRERELAESLDESVKMYEVYVDKMQKLMRERRQNKNPLKRKMAVIEVDQSYLDRYAEVLKLRREMLNEFARMLGDDPRLLSRYLDLIKRQQQSLRDQLSELTERQEEITREVSGWLVVGENQREQMWLLAAELRVYGLKSLAKDTAELAERIEKQLPLVLDPSAGTPSAIIRHASQVAQQARDVTLDGESFLQNIGHSEKQPPLSENAIQLVEQFTELDAALDQLLFENEEEEVVTYVNSRLTESRTVADQAESWVETARALETKNYPKIAKVDQHKVAIATELLRVEMIDIESQLETQFRQQTEAEVPGEIVDRIRRLKHVMEAITMNQVAATFTLSGGKLQEAQKQQMRALERLRQAGKLFDEIRRAVINELDSYEVDDPNIADLEDPTLDEFLSRLEREPNIEAQLGIPNRPRNLRVIADTMVWSQRGGSMLGSMEEAAQQRAREAMKMRKPPRIKQKKSSGQTVVEEQEDPKRAEEIQKMLQKSLASLQKKTEDPGISEGEKRKLKQMSERMQQLLNQARKQRNQGELWKAIAQSDQAEAVLNALARGESIPDQQWNKLVSELSDGLWQVRGKTPPEEYRNAIEQYQDQIRRLTDTIVEDEMSP